MRVPLELRRSVWRAMLDAQLQYCYWDTIGRRYYDRDKYARVFLAATSSSTVAGWSFWQDTEIFWKVLSGMSALVAIAMPILNWQKISQRMIELRENWHVLLGDYESLWLDVQAGDLDSKTIRGQLKSIRTKEAKLDKPSAALPLDKKLQTSCDAQVRKLRGFRNVKKELSDHGNGKSRLPS